MAAGRTGPRRRGRIGGRPSRTRVAGPAALEDAGVGARALGVVAVAGLVGVVARGAPPVRRARARRQVLPQSARVGGDALGPGQDTLPGDAKGVCVEEVSDEVAAGVAKHGPVVHQVECHLVYAFQKKEADVYEKEDCDAKEADTSSCDLQEFKLCSICSGPAWLQ